MAAALLPLAALAGCGGHVTMAGDVTVLVAAPAVDGMDALGGGRLEVVGGCLGASGSVIVWPHGTEVVAEDPLTISIPDVGTYRLGDDVRIGGGYVLEHTSSDVTPGRTTRAGSPSRPRARPTTSSSRADPAGRAMVRPSRPGGAPPR